MVQPADPVYNLSVAKDQTANADEDGSGSITPGDTLTYEIVVTNGAGSDGPVSGITVTDGLPDAALVSGGDGCTGSLSVGTSCTVTVTYKIPENFSAPGNLDNTAEVTTAETGATKYEATETVPVVQPADPVYNLSVAKDQTANADEDGSGSITPGDTLTYEIVVTNGAGSDGPVSGITVTDGLPDAALVSGGDGCTGSLSVGTSCTVTVTYKIPENFSAPGNLDNTAEVTTAETGATKYEATETVPVVQPIDPPVTPRPNPGPGAQNIPVFGPFGLLAILFGLAYFGRRRQK